MDELAKLTSPRFPAPIPKSCSSAGLPVEHLWPADSNLQALSPPLPLRSFASPMDRFPLGLCQLCHTTHLQGFLYTPNELTALFH